MAFMYNNFLTEELNKTGFEVVELLDKVYFLVISSVNLKSTYSILTNLFKKRGLLFVCFNDNRDYNSPLTEVLDIYIS
jgi:hypothetical protein